MRPRLRAGYRARDEDRGRHVELLRVRRHQWDARVPALPLILVNGVQADSIPATDRGLAFGDGVFRTMHVRHGRPLNWVHHYRRLAADCATLALPLPDERDVLAEIARASPGEATVKLIVTRGAGGRGYAPLGLPPTRVVAAFAPPDFPAALPREGVQVRRCALVLSEQPRIAGAKTLNRLENVLARGEWTDPEIREGLLEDAAGRVIEGTMSNVFVAKGGRVATPGLTRCGVIGAQRERVRELLAAEGIACGERDIRFEEIDDADEVFLTNSLIGAWPVCRCGDRRWMPGPITRRVQALVEQHDAQPR